MSEKDNEKKNALEDDGGNKFAGPFDPAGDALSKALKKVFVLLKWVMALLVILFLFSGVRIVGSNEQALVLRFGKIRGAGEKRVLGSGLKLLLPYPIDEIVRIPVETKVNLTINSFWYPPSKRKPDSLDPVTTGYCITRSETTGGLLEGSDYGIVHSKWQLTYQIYNPELFFKNIYIEDIKPGEIYSQVAARTVNPLLRRIFESAVVTAMVNYTTNDVLFDKVAAVSEHVKRLLQQELEQIESGIKVVSVQLDDKTWPQQVDTAFLDSIKAGQLKGTLISNAETYAMTTLSETAGSVAIAEQLLEVIHNKNISEEQRELLWSQLVGNAQKKITDAIAYRGKVVQNAKANADYLTKILPEYRKHPKLVLQNIYYDAIEEVLVNADEKLIIQPTYGVKGKEIRIIISRDPKIKPKKEQEN